MKVAVKNLEIVLLCFIIESNVCIVCTPLSAAGGWAFNQIFKKGSLTGPQLLEGVAGKDGVPFFGGGGCNCHIKNNIFLCHDKELNNNLLKVLKYLHENNEADVNSYWILMWQFGNLFPQQMFIDHFAMVLYGYFQKQPFADVLSKRCS